MSSTPVTPSPTSAVVAHPAPPTTATVSGGLITKIEKDYDWFKLHLISLVVIVAVLYGGFSFTLSEVHKLISDHDVSVAAEQQREEGVNTATQSALLAQLQQEQTAAAARDAQENTLIQTLAQQITASRAATAKQVQTDANADAASTAARIATQTKASPSDVTATDTSVTLSLPIARTVTSNLDLGAQAESDVTNIQGQLTAQQTINTDTAQQLNTANQTIAADKQEIVDTVKADDAACTVKVNTAVSNQKNTDAKHNKIWGTIIFILGAAAGHGI